MFRFSEKSGVHGFSGLHGTSGVYGNSGVYKVSGFNPLDLDPYLLFDAESSMIGTFENPTLDLDPATPSTLDVITATRAGTTATFTDSSGLIQVASPNTTRVDYTQGAELTPTKFQNFGNTDFTSSLWVKNNATVTFNQEPAPDGTQTAAKYVGSGTGQDLYYNSTFTGPFTYSLFVKYINAPYVRLRNDSTSTWFNLTTGSVATKNHDSASIEDVGDSWFRISVTVSSASSLLRAYIHPHATDNTTLEQDGGSFYLWGPQLEEGTTASPFVANTTLSPKFITGATFGPRVPMILVEPSATNLLPYSEDATQWGGSNRTVTSNTTTAPDGNQTADTIVRTAGNGDVRGTIQSVTAGLDYSLSVFAKADTDALIKLDVSNAVFGSGDVTFNAKTGEQTAGDTTKTSVEVFPNGWRRFVFTPTCALTGTSSTIIRLDNDEPVQLWGFQFEEGSVATSYIPTSNSTVTRAADDLVISGSDFSDFYNQSEGTFYFEGVPQNLTDDTIYWMDMSPSNQRIAIYDGPSYNVRFFVENTESVSAAYYPANQLARLAISVKSNAQELSVNGAASVNLTKSSLPSPTSLHIGSRYSLGNHLGGHLKRLIYWPYSSERL